MFRLLHLVTLKKSFSRYELYGSAKNASAADYLQSKKYVGISYPKGYMYFDFELHAITAPSYNDWIFERGSNPLEFVWVEETEDDVENNRYPVVSVSLEGHNEN